MALTGNWPQLLHLIKKHDLFFLATKSFVLATHRFPYRWPNYHIREQITNDIMILAYL